MTKKVVGEYDCRRVRHNPMNQLLVDLVAGTRQPLSIVDTPQMKDYCAKLNPSYKLPCRQTLGTSLIPKRSADIKSKLDELLTFATNLAVTVDLWSSRHMRSFIGITGHLI